MELFSPEPVAWIQQTLGPGWEAPATLVSFLGGAWGAILALGLALWLWGRKGLHVALAVLFVEAVAKKALAAAFSVPRPEGGTIIKYEDVQGVSSFPSGHTSSAAALFGALGAGRLALLWVGLLVGGAVGLSRLFLGVHWVPDVVAGLALGLGVAAAVAVGAGPIHRALARSPRGMEWAVGLAVTTLAVLGAFFWMGENAFSWRSVGFAAGLGVAVPAERTWVGWDPAAHPFARRAWLAVVGTAGVGVGMVVAWLVEPDALALQAGLAFLGTLWALLAAPALFRTDPTDPARPAQEEGA